MAAGALKTKSPAEFFAECGRARTGCDASSSAHTLMRLRAAARAVIPQAPEHCRL
jgi:hypothetical protein